MTELTSSVAPPYPAPSEKLKFYGIWVALALLLLVLPKIFGSGGALTTFSIANDVSKYFAIIPAAFMAIYPPLLRLNVMHLKTPESAILSAVIFNAIIIVLLIPLALRGVKYRAMSAHQLLRRHVWIYGVGGILVPFAGIKLIDLFLALFF